MVSDQKDIERARAYREMMNSWAWKDFSGLMASEKQRALEQGILSNKIEDVCTMRGFVQCINSLNSEIDSILRA